MAELSQLLETFAAAARGEVSLRQALGLHPQIFTKLVDQAVAQMERGEYSDAEQHLAALAAVEPNTPMLPFLLGSCRFELDNPSGAVEAFSKALSVAKRGAPKRFVRSVRFCRAQALRQLGKDEKAYKDLCAAAKSEDAAIARQAKAWRDELEPLMRGDNGDEKKKKKKKDTP